MAERSDLLVSYLSDNQVWLDLMDAYETVFGADQDRIALQLANLRDFMQLESDIPRVAGGATLDMSNLTLPDHSVLVRSCNMLGFTYPNVDSSLFSDEDYLRILQSLSLYYRQQGTESFSAFLSFCLNASYQLQSLWTQDYQNFVPAASAGTPIWDGGSWYPTSHVEILLDADSTQTIGSSLSRFRQLFDYIAPIHLVLYRIVTKSLGEGNLYQSVMSRTIIRSGSVKF